MAIMRVHKNANYTVMSNNHFKEKEMSLKAKGLLSLMLSLPDDWDYSINGLATLSKDGKHSVMEALKELERFGYLIRVRITNEKGQFKGYDYDIFEHPVKVESYPQTDVENPVVDDDVNGPSYASPNSGKPYSENPNTDNRTQLNTKESSTEEINYVKNKDRIDRIDKRKSAEFSLKEPSPFSKELIKAGYIEKEDLRIGEYNELFNRLIEENGFELTRSCLWYFIKQHKWRDGKDDNGEEVENRFAYFKTSMENGIRRVGHVNEWSKQLEELWG
jgi:hypothetical protein